MEMNHPNVVAFVSFQVVLLQQLCWRCTCVSSAPWDALAAACLCTCSSWVLRSYNAFSTSSTVARCHTLSGCAEVSFVHGDLVLACSNPFAEESGFVTCFA